MRYQAHCALSLPYAPSVDKAKKIDNILASKKALRVATSDRTVAFIKTALDRQAALDIVQEVGRMVRNVMDCAIRGEVALREVAESEGLPLLFERQQSLPLRSVTDTRLIFGAVHPPGGGGLAHLSFYRAGKKVFDYRDLPVLGETVNEAQYSSLLRGLEEVEKELGELVAETTLCVVSPCELVIKQCRMNSREESQWSIRPALVRYVKDVLSVVGRFRKVYWLLPGELSSVSSKK